MKKLNELSTITPDKNDWFYLMSNDGTVEGKQQLYQVTDIPETTRTVNLNNTMTTSEIQDAITAVGRYIPEAQTVTFQFADGTYNLDDTLYFQGFYGNGSIIIQGNDSETTGLHTNQAVHLNFNNDTNGLFISGCHLNQHAVSRLKITADDGYQCIAYYQNNYGIVLGCYLLNNGKTSGLTTGVYTIGNGSLRVLTNYFSNNYSAIRANHASYIYSENNDDTGTQPNYGLLTRSTGVIGKSGTQPAGSTANENSATGGEIR